MEIFTLGTSTRTWQTFLALLEAHRIQLVADVRSVPRSRRHPHFSAEAMAGALPAAGIQYRWLGRGLGGYREGGYEGYRESGAYREAIAVLEALARIHRTACVCAERSPADCHRRFIAETLQTQGWEVTHLIDEGVATPHGSLDDSRGDGRSLQPDLFD